MTMKYEKIGGPTMTREEAIERIKVLKARCERLALNSSRGFSEWKMDVEACEIAISALTPHPQEQVKELYPGAISAKKELADYPLVSAIGECGDSVNSYMPGYCPLCGHPFVPKTREETKKLEALKDE